MSSPKQNLCQEKPKLDRYITQKYYWQLQLKKGCSGTILTAINKDEFRKIMLPKVDKETQTQIQQKIREAFNLRKRSKHLLECAKRAV